MHKYFATIPNEELKYISSHISKANRDEIAVWLDKHPEEMNSAAVSLALRLTAIDSLTMFVLYDAKDRPGAFGCVSPRGAMSFVICEGIDRKTYVRWLRHSREIVDHCARLAGGEIGCLADSRNELAQKWFAFAGLERHEETTVTKAGVTFVYYDHRIPLAEQ